MPVTETVTLSQHLRDELRASGGTMVALAAEVGIPYERLKQSIRQNTFNAEDLQRLKPGMTVEELSAAFTFKLARSYAKETTIEQQSETLEIDEEDMDFICENKIVRERISNLIREECRRLRALFQD